MPAAPKFKVRVRFQLYVEGPLTGLTIAGPRLLKGDGDTKPCPRNFDFVSDSLPEAETNAKTLEAYLNDWERKNGGKVRKKHHEQTE